MTQDRLECVDAGSEFCPCYLAETNDCITCSHLQGKDFCNCNWRGVCIYQEYVWNGKKSKVERGTFISKIVNKEEINQSGIILKLKVTKTLSRQLREPGAYVFLRGKNLPEYFDVPISIMDADEMNGYIYIAYQLYGAKTKRLNEENQNLLVRGPYWNGVFGLRNLKKMRDDKCLLIVRGIAQAPSVLVAKKLIKNNNEVTIIADKGKIGKLFIEDYLSELDINIIEEDVMSDKGKFLIKRILKNEKIDLIYSGGSDVLHQEILSIIDELKINPHLVITNNKEICCGEGICGSCSTYLGDGVVVKACKTQIDVRKAIERRILHD